MNSCYKVALYNKDGDEVWAGDVNTSSRQMAGKLMGQQYEHYRKVDPKKIDRGDVVRSEIELR